ncbi:MAG: hypothetical protein US81_C0008G0002 [Parcubacteria group bacterium GW2011_GWE2_38_18]|nr:MAG: hypothetical protein US81_C0008G0002 [Parcubacteria group bacterium GW2011_GWE2_38_18]
MKIKKVKFLILLFVISTSFMWPKTLLMAESLASKLRGRILIDVESHGEAWYVNPSNLQRYYLGRPADAFSIMRQLGLGISNKDFDSFAGTAPRRLSGKILIKTEDLGKAYYINPLDLKLHYLGRPADAFALMRKFGLGISVNNLAQLPIYGGSSQVVSTQMERNIADLINQERTSRGLQALKWNEDIAAVARQHSADQARQDADLINQNKLCSYPFIHHEGIDFGIYQSERLNNKGVYYFSASAENIALIPRISGSQYTGNVAPIDCQSQLNQLNSSFQTRVKSTDDELQKIQMVTEEINKRKELVNLSPSINIINTYYNTSAEIEKQAVTGWMNSPGHRQNILTPDYDEAGIGIAEVEGYYIITQVFIKKAACGYQGGACCTKPNYLPYCYIPLGCSTNVCQ